MRFSALPTKNTARKTRNRAKFHITVYENMPTRVRAPVRRTSKRIAPTILLRVRKKRVKARKGIATNNDLKG